MFRLREELKRWNPLLLAGILWLAVAMLAVGIVRLIHG